MSQAQPRTTALRRLIERQQVTLLCGVQDGISAALAERAGFEALWASGFCVSSARRMPDVGLLTMTEHLAASREMHRASALPVVADVDDGFGDVVNVTRMVREYEAAGIAGVCIEDNRHPKRCSLFGELDRKLVTPGEFVSKIRAAKAAQSDPDFVVIARTEAIVAELGVDEAMRRAKAYAAAGADLVLVHSKDSTPDRVLQFAADWDGRVPLAAVPTKYPSVTHDALFAAGFRIAIFANQGLRAAIGAMDRVFRKMVETRSLASVEQEVVPLSEIYDLVGFDEVREIERKFLGAPEPADDDNA